MTLLWDGPLDLMPPSTRASVVTRRTSFESAIETVRAIRDDVRRRGDEALLDLTEKLDGVKLAALEVPRVDWEGAMHRLPKDARDALVAAFENLARFHRATKPESRDVEVLPGVVAGKRWIPHARAGVYVPGGRAAYPSTVLMAAAPARAAGVREVVVCTPPGRDGRIPDATLAACAVAGVDRVFAVGGAQAVFAMAFGTRTIPKVDKLVGPGNAYVAAAKALVAGEVAIDSPAGPSEVLVLHVGSATGERERDARFAVAEVVAQAEHDPDAACVVVTTDGAFAAEVRRALPAAVAATPRREIVEKALAARGALVLAMTQKDAVRFADEYAPEHVVVLAPEPRVALEKLSHYGSAFLGPYSTVAFGDYCAGPNHVLPTAGLARSYSGLGTEDFLRRPTHQTVSAEAARALAPLAARLARLEGLHAHAAAAESRGGGRDA